jgi:hypothetical protein
MDISENKVVQQLTNDLVNAIRSNNEPLINNIITEFRNNGVTKIEAMAMAKFVMTDNE